MPDVVTAVMPLLWGSALLLQPVEGVLTQGVTTAHRAIDLSCVAGAPVHAAHDGVGVSHWDRDLGLVVTLRDSQGLITTYGHLQSAAPAGSFLRGAVIGTCGNSGRLTTGAHLHFGSNQLDRLQQLASPLPAATDVAVQEVAP